MEKKNGAQSVQVIPETGVAEGHFATVEEALDWLKTEINIQIKQEKEVDNKPTSFSYFFIS